MTIILAAAVIILLMVAAGLAIRLSLYRKQILHMKEELMMIQKEDTNYRLSSYCHIGETEEVIRLFNAKLTEVQQKAAELGRENRIYRESITSISHDIRTPLTSAKGYMQMLSAGEGITEEKKKSYITTVERRIDAVTDMLNQLFEYARVEAGEMEFIPERINLGNLFADTIALFYDDFVKKGCEPEIMLTETPCLILADRHAMSRIIENLIKNALVHGVGDYRFSLRRQGDTAYLSVSNRTSSIEQRDMDRIFDRFYTTDTSRTKKTTGLGLAIVKQFAERMGQTVSASLDNGIFSVEITFTCVD